MDTGLLLARMVFGLLMAAHGTQKLFGWFGGYGLAGTAGFFEQLGFRPGRCSPAPRPAPKSSPDCWWRSACSGRSARR